MVPAQFILNVDMAWFPKLLIAKLRLYQNRQENKKTFFFQGGAKPNQISVYLL